MSDNLKFFIEKCLSFYIFIFMCTGNLSANVIDLSVRVFVFFVLVEVFSFAI